MAFQHEPAERPKHHLRKGIFDERLEPLPTCFDEFTGHYHTVFDGSASFEPPNYGFDDGLVARLRAHLLKDPLALLALHLAQGLHYRESEFAHRDVLAPSLEVAL